MLKLAEIIDCIVHVRLAPFPRPLLAFVPDTLSPSSSVISVIILEESRDCVYVVILPVSLAFIFSTYFFFFNLADVKKLLKFAFLDYKLA